jgi:hypothetical protein
MAAAEPEPVGVAADFPPPFWLVLQPAASKAPTMVGRKNPHLQKVLMTSNNMFIHLNITRLNQPGKHLKVN